MPTKKGNALFRAIINNINLYFRQHLASIRHFICQNMADEPEAKISRLAEDCKSEMTVKTEPADRIPDEPADRIHDEPTDRIPDGGVMVDKAAEAEQQRKDRQIKKEEERKRMQ